MLSGHELLSLRDKPSVIKGPLSTSENLNPGPQVPSCATGYDDDNDDE